MAKKRVVTATKTMRFRTSHGSETDQEHQVHAEEREAKRWLQTRLAKYEALARKYEPGDVDSIVLAQSAIKHYDMMKMAPETTMGWNARYGDKVLFFAVRRIA